MGDVHYLPDRDQPDVVEGEVVSEIVPTEIVPTQRELAHARWDGYRRDALVVTRVVKTAVTHQRTRTAVKLTARNLIWYPVAGAAVVIKRWRDTHGPNRYERLMRQAELAGNQDALLEWESRDTTEKQRRHNRIMDWVKAPKELAKALAIVFASFTGLLLVIGLILAAANGDIEDVLGPIMGFFEMIQWTSWFLAAYGMLMLLAVSRDAVPRARLTPVRTTKMRRAEMLVCETREVLTGGQETCMDCWRAGEGTDENGNSWPVHCGKCPCCS